MQLKVRNCSMNKEFGIYTYSIPSSSPPGSHTYAYFLLSERSRAFTARIHHVIVLLIAAEDAAPANGPFKGMFLVETQSFK